MSFLPLPLSRPLLRRAALVSAFALALVVSGTWPPSRADAQTAGTPAKASSSSKGGSSAKSSAPANSTAPAEPSASSDAGGAPSDSAAEGSGSGKSDIEQHAIVVEKGGKRVRVVGIGEKDREFDSMNDFLKNEPDFAGMVVAVVAIIFLSPVFLVAIVMAYRMRKARLLNEALLRLAERGVVPPAEAMQALGGGQLPPAITQPATASTSGAPAASLLDQAKQVRTRAAWSDLRKGVIVGAIGLAFTVHDVGRGRAPDTVGLILLFIGIAYGALWWYETRRLPDRNTIGNPGGGT